MVTDAWRRTAPLDARSYFYPQPLLDGDPEAAADALSGSIELPVGRAVIGDSLRIPLVRCQFSSCTAFFTDEAALGERDVRSRAIAAGWRQDGLTRMACPECAQRDPTFMVVHPPAEAGLHR